MIGERALIRFFLFLWLPLSAFASDINIFTAAADGDLVTVKKLVKADPQSVTQVDERGYSPLHKAAYNNRLDMAEFLLAQGADVNAASSGGSTPLHGAAYYGHPDMVRLLLDAGASIDVANSGGYTPILSAAAGGRAEIVQLLTEKRANINVRGNDGNTPLYLAIFNADSALTRFLIDRGAEANIMTNMGISLPYFAIAFRDRELSRRLAEKATDFTETDSFGLTMLHYSAARGFLDEVQMFLKRGAEANARDSLGRTPLFYASLWGHDQVADTLKAYGASADGLYKPWFEGDYLGRPAPGKRPVEFVGDELRTPFTPHGRIIFSPDGNEMIWCHHAMPIQAMWYSRQVDGLWQRPFIAPFTDPALEYADGHPCFSADGKRIYYHTQRPLTTTDERKEDQDIWYVDRSGDGWASPVHLGPPINSEKNEFGPTIAPSGNLYFTGSEYENGFGAADIYISEFIHGSYNTPQNLGPEINGEYHDLYPAVPSDESYIVFASNRSYLFSQNLGLYVSFKKPDGGWTQAVSLGRTVNQGQSWQPFITADDKFIIYLQGALYRWFSTDLIEDIRKATVPFSPAAATARIPAFRKTDQIFDHAATNYIALGDLDNDGDLDAVFSNMAFYDSRIYLNNGHGQFTASDQLLTRQGHGVDLGDLDGDGDLDIFITCAGYGRDNISYDRPSRVYFNDGRANFTVSGQDLGDSLLSGNEVRLFDIDTDGDLDAVILYYQEDNGIYLNDGLGQFTRSDLTFPDGANWADLDGDGDVDILQREPEVGFKTLLNDGAGRFVEHWSKADADLNRGGICFADIDKDGDLDVVVAFHDQSEHRFSTVWLNDGTGRFKETDIKLPMTRNARMAAADFNGDGYLDVFLNNFGLPSAIWLNDGRGGLFDSGIRFPGEWLNGGCAPGDIDGDGDQDIFIAAFGGGPNEIWFNE